MTQEEMWTNNGPPIYIDSTKIRVVDAESPDAAFLLVAAGSQIPMSVAKQYGVTEKPPEAEQTTMDQVTEVPPIGDQVAELPETEPLEAEPRKGKPAPATKLRETPDNKSGQG
jgi:hypothetical protein